MKFCVLKKKNIFIAIAVILCAVLLSLSIDGTRCASVFFGMTTRKVPVYCVDTTEKKVAITFDSAWGADKTKGILDTLKEYNAKATFFLVGFWVEDYPDAAKMINEYGIEIGTHSNTHPDFTTLNESQMRQELEASTNIIKDTVGVTPKLFRAPYGAYNNAMLGLTESMGLTTIQWDVDTLDWKGLSAMEITNRVLNNVKNGSIILCHNNSDHILDALPLVLDRLTKQGYEVVGVSDLLIQGEYYIDNLGVQKKK